MGWWVEFTGLEGRRLTRRVTPPQPVTATSQRKPQELSPALACACNLRRQPPRSRRQQAAASLLASPSCGRPSFCRLPANERTTATTRAPTPRCKPSANTASPACRRQPSQRVVVFASTPSVSTARRGAACKVLCLPSASPLPPPPRAPRRRQEGNPRRGARPRYTPSTSNDCRTRQLPRGAHSRLRLPVRAARDGEFNLEISSRRVPNFAAG